MLLPSMLIVDLGDPGKPAMRSQKIITKWLQMNPASILLHPFTMTME